jgi:hypothetical protein
VFASGANAPRPLLHSIAVDAMFRFISTYYNVSTTPRSNVAPGPSFRWGGSNCSIYLKGMIEKSALFGEADRELIKHESCRGPHFAKFYHAYERGEAPSFPLA